MSDRTSPSSSEIRQQFLDFFAGKAHAIVPSAPLVPLGDPTLLFTNAGMNQFKDIFLGQREPEHTRVADAQKCMRVSGKHNDLDDVGRSPFHHTFFEMLGNWSFGDYYKKEAIAWAWELLTEVWRLPKERLWATVFEDDKGNLGRDEEAYTYWCTLTQIARENILYFGRKDNFWEMGETGPCGPCSEIHLDMGSDACNKREVPGHVCRVNGDCRRFIELWNLVFIQYNHTRDDRLEELPAKHVDTGMGFERAVKVLQGVDSNYETDLFWPIIRRTQVLLGNSDAERDERLVSFRVIADHGRAVTFLIGDGVLPSNEGRGYVLRLILRRAARHGRLLGFTGPFLAEIARTVIEIMGPAYDELMRRQEFILKTIEHEEKRFSQTLDIGLAMLDETIRALKAEGLTVIPGQEAFRLYDTFGFPLDLTRDVARDHGMTVDTESYQAALTEQQDRARAAAQFGASEVVDIQLYLDVLRESKATGALPFTGVQQICYDATTVETTLVTLLRDGQPVQVAGPGDRVALVVPVTPFYVESGGQVTDTGVIEASVGPGSKPAWQVRIHDARRPVPGLIVHLGEVDYGTPTVGDAAKVTVDQKRREDIMRNHTATHLLQRELRRTLGEHVHQAGSVVAPDRLRFDFTHAAPLSSDEREAVEREVNEVILADYPVVPSVMRYRDAVASGATALFTEKYGDEVRVIRIGGGEAYSKELCGGTHVSHTGQIGLFHIVSEESIGAGVRRVEAVTGRGAQALVQERLRLVDEVAGALHVRPDELDRAVQTLQGELQASHKELARLRSEVARQQTVRLADEARRVRAASGAGPEVAVVAASVAGADMDTLREMSDWLRDRLGSAVVVLATAVDGKPQMIAAVTEDLVQRGLHAGNLIKAVARIVGGSGGGRPALAQAGGRDLARLSEALDQVPGLVVDQLSRVG
jgi:alanyl-tRNA synthetase